MRGAPWLEHERRELEAWLDERAAARLSGGNRASAEVQRHSGGMGTLRPTTRGASLTNSPMRASPGGRDGQPHSAGFPASRSRGGVSTLGRVRSASERNARVAAEPLLVSAPIRAVESDAVRGRQRLAAVKNRPPARYLDFQPGGALSEHSGFARWYKPMSALRSSGSHRSSGRMPEQSRPPAVQPYFSNN
jgi:hypothetical protein